MAQVYYNSNKPTTIDKDHATKVSASQVSTIAITEIFMCQVKQKQEMAATGYSVCTCLITINKAKVLNQFLKSYK